MKQYKRAAETIAGQIARDALWSGDRCNWLQWEICPKTGRRVQSSCNNSLHHGTAGITWFLAITNRSLGNPEMHDVIRAAVNQIMSSDLDSAKSLGYGDGLLGILVSSIAIANLIDSDELREYSRDEIVPRIVNAPLGNQPTRDHSTRDLARAVPILVASSSACHCPSLLEVAKEAVAKLPDGTSDSIACNRALLEIGMYEPVAIKSVDFQWINAAEVSVEEEIDLIRISQLQGASAIPFSLKATTERALDRYRISSTNSVFAPNFSLVDIELFLLAEAQPELATSRTFIQAFPQTIVHLWETERRWPIESNESPANSGLLGGLAGLGMALLGFSQSVRVPLCSTIFPPTA